MELGHEFLAVADPGGVNEELTHDTVRLHRQWHHDILLQLFQLRSCISYPCHIRSVNPHIISCMGIDSRQLFQESIAAVHTPSDDAAPHSHSRIFPLEHHTVRSCHPACYTFVLAFSERCQLSAIPPCVLDSFPYTASHITPHGRKVSTVSEVLFYPRIALITCHPAAAMAPIV